MILFENEEKFKNFYLQKSPALISFAYRFVDSYTAEDIVHDIFIKLWKNRLELDTEQSIESYVFRMVQNSCMDYLKHKNVEFNYLEKSYRNLSIEELQWYENTDDIFIDDKRLEIIYSAIQLLPDKCRDIFIKAYIEEESHNDIAKFYNISIRTVDSQIYKALRIIRNRLLTLISIFFLFFLK